MTDYYALLKIDRSASQAEIRRAYRRLAILLHPDKNPHPEAAEGFRSITEAYEVLGDPFKKVLYDQMLHGHEASLSSPHRDPAYRPRSRPVRVTPQPKPYFFLYRYSIIIVWSSILFCAMLAVDFFLPEKIIDDVVVRDQRTLQYHILHTASGRDFEVLFPLNMPFNREPEIHIRVSPLLGFLKGIETRSGDFQLNNLPSLYRNFLFAPILLGLISVISLVFMDKNGEAQFNAAIVLVILFLLNMFFFAWSKW